MSTIIICTICFVWDLYIHLYELLLFFEKKFEINENYNKVKLYYRYMKKKIAFTAPARSDVKVIYHKNMAQMSDILSCAL